MLTLLECHLSDLCAVVAMPRLWGRSGLYSQAPRTTFEIDRLLPQSWEQPSAWV